MSGIVANCREMSRNQSYENNRFFHIGKFSHFETFFRKITCQEMSGNAILSVGDASGGGPLLGSIFQSFFILVSFYMKKQNPKKKMKMCFLVVCWPFLWFKI